MAAEGVCRPDRSKSKGEFGQAVAHRRLYTDLLLAKILQILAANLVVLPVVLAGYIGASAVVNGAKTIGQVINAVKANFRKAYRVSFFTNPMSVIFAQRFIAPQFWTSFFGKQI